MKTKEQELTTAEIKLASVKIIIELLNEQELDEQSKILVTSALQVLNLK